MVRMRAVTATLRAILLVLRDAAWAAPTAPLVPMGDRAAEFPPASNDPVARRCDLLANLPIDAQKVGAGVEFERINAAEAIPASGNAGLSPVLTLRPGSVVRNNGGHGIHAFAPLGLTNLIVDIDGATISGSALAGIRTETGTGCRVRNTLVSNNAQFGVHMRYRGICDLGSVASPGGNTFSNVGPNVSVDTPNLLVSAVGNTWQANEQGADAQGRYVVPAAGTTLEFTGPITSGRNYRLYGLFNDKARIKLAE